MRSELVFVANDAVTNRFLLCRVVSLSTRKFHTEPESLNSTINDVLERVGANAVKTFVVVPPKDNLESQIASQVTEIKLDLEF